MLLGIAILLAGAPAWRAAACEGLEVVFEDKFADDAGGWPLKDNVEVKDGSFVFKLPPDDMQSDLNVTFTVHDADICSETVWPTGDQPILGAGLLFWGEDNRTYFQFGVLNNGKFWIARKQDGKWLGTIAANVESNLGVPVKITGTLNRGKIELRYSSREELERVCAKLVP